MGRAKVPKYWTNADGVYCVQSAIGLNAVPYSTYQYCDDCPTSDGETGGGFDPCCTPPQGGPGAFSSVAVTISGVSGTCNPFNASVSCDWDDTYTMSFCDLFVIDEDEACLPAYYFLDVCRPAPPPLINALLVNVCCQGGDVIVSLQVGFDFTPSDPDVPCAGGSATNFAYFALALPVDEGIDCLEQLSGELELPFIEQNSTSFCDFSTATVTMVLT